MATPLKFGDVLGETFQRFFGNFRAFADLSLIPMIMTAAITAAPRIVLGNEMPLGYSLGVVMLLDLVPTSMFLIGWYRLMLLGPGSVARVPGTAWTAREKRLAGHTIWIFGLPAVLMAISAAHMPTGPTEMPPPGSKELPPGMATMAVLALPTMVTLLIGLRASFGLAACAVDAAPWSPRLAWTYSRGARAATMGALFLLFVVGTMAAFTIYAATSATITAAFGRPPSPGPEIVLQLAAAFAAYVKTALLATGQAIVFRELAGFRAGMPLRPPPP